MNSTASSTDFSAHGKLVGRLSVLAAALFWSSSGLFAKAPLFDDWSDSTRGPLLAFWRALFAGLVLLPFVRRPRWKPALVPLGVCFTGMNVTYLTAMTLTTAANAIWLQSLCPWWVFLFAVFVLRQPVIRRDLVPLCFGLVGVGMILLFEMHGQAKLGVTCGVLSGVFFAGVVVLMQQLRHENRSWLIVLNHLIAAAFLLPWVIHLNVWPSPTQLVILAAFGTFQMAIPYLLLTRALRSISSQEAVAIGLVEPVLLPLWVFLVWGEVPAWWTIAGASLILVGLLLRYVVVPAMVRDS